MRVRHHVSPKVMIGLVPLGRVVTFPLVLCLLGGCFGDAPPDPATALLEVVLDQCKLNRPQVAPGSHRIDAIRYEGEGPGRVVVTDENGEVMLDVASGGAGYLTTTEQTYTFTCTVPAETKTAFLESTPDAPSDF